MAGKIFISYRRSETAWAARALFERLRRQFDDRVFIDIEGLSLGTDYTKVIDSHLEGCEVMLAIIGEQWLAEIQRRAATGASEDEEAEPDWVRAELARALLRGIPVVPVLIENAQLPAKKDLPAELKGLRNRHGMELHARFFDDQTGRLAREIAKIIAAPAPAAPAPLRATSPAVAPAPIAAAPPALAKRPAWMHDEGTDPYGRWAEFKVQDVVQRLRWIEPGTFWMGTPETEAERHSDELRHRVTLTQGYWMADTACTQALWQAVMGSNPSHFKAELTLPVETVSWAEINGVFLPKLNRLVPGLGAALPTEAQWEYACRAGTQTPFSFGEQVNPSQVNYDGTEPYAGGQKGEFRKSTVPVGSLPPNPWGLYEMHGNVWEWCADVFVPYGKAEAMDPAGPPPSEGALRAVRGGSWSVRSGDCRAGYRYWSSPGNRYYGLGLRVVCCPIPVP